MKALRRAAAWTGFSILVMGVLPSATGTASAADTQKLPQGRPFRMLQQAITDLNAEVQAQIADLETQLATLEGRVDMVEERQATQDVLIGTLQAAISMLQQDMIGARADINALHAWTEMQDALWEQLNSRINELQQEVEAQSDDIDLLWELQQQQQIAIAQLRDAIDFLRSQGTAQQGTIEELQGQLAALVTAYGATQQQLATGCPPRSSIRQLPVSGPLVCESDSGTSFQQLQQANVATVAPGAVVQVSASCPSADPPYVPTGGGFSGAAGADVLQSRPLGSSAWAVTVRNTGLTPITFIAYAICARGLPLP